mmetsp:Transcript_8392/g.13122  ORF Transcript_8392/g.13122 Transcript_8392/m.13122 type:complete len:111 (-) Transcript_8392:798-1130(-)
MTPYICFYLTRNVLKTFLIRNGQGKTSKIHRQDLPPPQEQIHRLLLPYISTLSPTINHIPSIIIHLLSANRSSLRWHDLVPQFIRPSSVHLHADASLLALHLKKAKLRES